MALPGFVELHDKVLDKGRNRCKLGTEGETGRCPGSRLPFQAGLARPFGAVTSVCSRTKDGKTDLTPES